MGSEGRAPNTRRATGPAITARPMPAGMLNSAVTRRTASMLFFRCSASPRVYAAVTLGSALMPNACVMAGTSINSVSAIEKQPNRKFGTVSVSMLICGIIP